MLLSGIIALTISLLYQTEVINSLMTESGVHLANGVLRLSREEHTQPFLWFLCGTIHTL